MNYSSWVYYFSHLCHGYGILDHLVDPVASSSTTTPTDPPPKDAEWTKIDFIIRSWIFSTLAPSLRKRLVDLNPTTAKDAWTYIEAIFQDNKRPRAMALKAELRNLKLDNLSIDEYFQKIESIVSVLNGLGSPLSNDDVSRVQNPLVDATSASPMVLLAKSNTSARRGPSLEKVNNPCWSFAKGSCRFGDAFAYTVSVPLGFQSVSAQLSAQPTYVSPQLLPGSFGVSNMGMAGLFPQGVQYPTGSPQQGVYYPQQGVQTLSVPPQGVHLVPGSVHLGQSPSMPFYPSQLFASGSQGSGQVTLLPNAFNTTTL
ncbi:ribonuclease H-like domain-containing protein [Tanacetum coccineum]